MRELQLAPSAYVPTGEDRLWLLRAVEAEGEPRPLVAQALVNRYVWLLSRGVERWPTLGEFVRAYSAPVNPRRMKGGDIWEKLYREGDAAQRKSLEAADRRRRAHSARDVFSPNTMAAVDRALVEAPDHPTITDFAAFDHEPSKGLVLVRPGERGVNAFYTSDPHWDGYYPVAGPLRAHLSESASTGKLLVAVGFVLVAAHLLGGNGAK